MEALIYLPDFETLRAIHADWPEEMRTILCLHQSGQCELHLRHVEEDAAAALRKAVEATDRGTGRFHVVPATGGYPTRRLSFSEEQALCGLLDGLTQLPRLAADYALEHRYNKEAALSREVAERAHSLAERLQQRSKPEAAMTRTAGGYLAGCVSMAEESFRLVVGGRDMSARTGREILGYVVDVPLRGSAVRVAWDGDVASGDVILIPYGSLPPAADALWRRGETDVRLKLVAHGAVVDPEHNDGERTWRLARVAAGAFLIMTTGILTAGVAVAFG